MRISNFYYFHQHWIISHSFALYRIVSAYCLSTISFINRNHNNTASIHTTLNSIHFFSLLLRAWEGKIYRKRKWNFLSRLRMPPRSQSVSHFIFISYSLVWLFTYFFVSLIRSIILCISSLTLTSSSVSWCYYYYFGLWCYASSRAHSMSHYSLYMHETMTNNNHQTFFKDQIVD